MPEIVEHICRKTLPKPRRWRVGQVRTCRCRRVYMCRVGGILEPRPMWFRVFDDDLTDGY